MHRALLRLHGLLARLLLPRAFRAEFADELAMIVEARVRAARGSKRSIVALLELLDLARTAAREWRRVVASAAGRGFRAFVTDLGYALRSFRSGRSALLLSAAVLALAAGAGTTTYSVVAGVVLRPLPFDGPEDLVSVRVVPRASGDRTSGGATMSAETVDLVQSTGGVFASSAWYYGSDPVMTGLGEPARIIAFTVGPKFFETLGTRPILGRPLLDSDAMPAGAVPVVVSERFWKERLGGAPDALGRTLTLNDRIHEVVGVVPTGFGEIGRGVDLWLPESEAQVVRSVGAIQGGRWLVGRLAPGVSIETALTRLDRRFDSYAREVPAYARWGAGLQGLREMIVGEVRGPLLLLMGAVVLVLLVACANVAAVFLARGVARQRELAVRFALGGSRLRVARQLVLEATLLSLGAGAAALAIASRAVPVAVSFVSADLPRAAEIGVDGGVLGAAVLGSLVTGVLAGLLPGILSVRSSLVEGLKDGIAGSGVRAWRLRFGEALVVVQIGLGTLLLVGAVLLTTTFVNLTTVDFGFEPARVVVAELRLPEGRYDDPAARDAFLSNVFERAGARGGIESVAASTGTPFAGGAFGTVELSEGETPEGAPSSWFTHVTPDYFDVIGLRLVRGSWLPEDVKDAVLVDEAFVRAFFGETDPIGRRVSFYGGSVDARIVGVVSDAVMELSQPAPPHIYPPIDKVGSGLKVLVRTRAGSAVTPEVLRDILREIDPLLPIDHVGTLRDFAWETVTRQRFYATALGTFAAVALLITALGVYGVSAYAVSRRTREIGIRIALGASRRRVWTLTLGRAVALGVLGIAFGLGAAAWAAELLEALLFDVSPTDPLVFVSVAAFLAGVAALAAYPPARRAARVDPIGVLRAE